MLASALVVFREILEAMLIISIVLVAARGVGRLRTYVSAGVLAGIAGACIVAAFADRISDLFAGSGQEFFNATVLFSAVALLGWHVVWMQRHGRELAAKFRALGESVIAGRQPLAIIPVIVALAVLREGSEVVLFLHGISANPNTGVWQVMGGAGLGFAAGAALSLALYFGLLRIPTKHFFAVTNWLIILLAAGMAAQGVKFLVQGGWLPAMGMAVWDSSWLLREQSLPGQLLHTLIGYVSRPDGIQIMVYVATLLLLGGMMRFVARINTRPQAVALLVTAVLLAGGAGDTLASHKIYSPLVEKGEMELELRDHITIDKDAARDGERKAKLEVGYGFSERWFSSLFVEFEKEGGAMEAEALAWENILQLSDQGQYWLDYGAYLEFEKTEAGNPDKLEAKLLLEKSLLGLTHTVNLVVERELGDNAGNETELGYAWRSRWRLSSKFEPALEIFGGLGDLDRPQLNQRQSHLAGPVVSGSFKLSHKSAFVYEAGYLVGLTDAAVDGTFKVLLEYELNF